MHERGISRSRLVVVSLVVATVAIVAGFAAPRAESRALATCTPYAYVPSVFDWYGQANGEVYCQSGAPSWYFTIRLKNRAGNTLTESQGGPISHSGWWGVGTNWDPCAGAYLHTFLYINVGGQGKSDTSGETSDCAY